MSERQDEPDAPLPVQVAELADGIRECADAIRAQIMTRGLYKGSTKDALRATSYHAGRAAELAARIVQLANDRSEGWDEITLSPESEWEAPGEGRGDDDNLSPEERERGEPFTAYTVEDAAAARQAMDTEERDGGEPEEWTPLDRD